MNKFFENMENGQKLITKTGKQFTAVNPHINTDEPDSPFIVYDTDNNCWFEEDIDIEKSILLCESEETDKIVFSKFHLPKDATSVQAVLIYSKDNGKTWEDQIYAEHTIACPEEMVYLPVTGDQKRMRQFGHNFIEDMWIDGFNTCLELFKNGKLKNMTPDKPNHIPTDNL